jgi:hypothetical protein|tara:strand:+ start:92 stop:226 length:135 start_codon:yes stop_codon:yes gene_type:complete
MKSEILLRIKDAVDEFLRWELSLRLDALDIGITLAVFTALAIII